MVFQKKKNGPKSILRPSSVVIYSYNTLKISKLKFELFFIVYRIIPDDSEFHTGVKVNSLVRE